MFKKTGLKYGDVTRLEHVHLGLTLAIRLPLVLLWKLLINLHKLVNPYVFVRTVGLAVGRDLLGALNGAQVQKLLPTSVGFYKLWARLRCVEVKIEELIDDTTLLWVGPKRTDKVILYAHGGAYIVPLLNQSLDFAHYLQRSLTKRGHDVGVAILAYSLVPTVGLESQITQTTRAIEHILASGVQPENLHLMGDSAGAQLMLAFFSHLLHPLDNVRKMTLPSPIGSAYLMSPWSSFSMDSPSMKENAHKDLLSVRALPEWIKSVSAQLTSQPAVNPFTSPACAPEGWFKSLDGLVHRVLITGGTDEVFRDDIKTLAEKLEKEKGKIRMTFVMQPGGVHIDPAIDFLFMMGPKRNSLTPIVVQWFAEALGGYS
ncbi:Alpha/Beta hydrolase protein [Panaeolus papilionaceus]|nr:Alpha/Beta hydrolase protein [Panaeolus papilionaceus]